MRAARQMVGTQMNKPEWRIYKDDTARKIGEFEGYVMARRKGCVPFVVPKKEWDALPLVEK